MKATVLLILSVLLVACGPSERELLELDSKCRDLASQYIAEERSKIIELPDVSESYDLMRMGYSRKKSRCLAVVTKLRTSFRPFETEYLWWLIDPAREETFAMISASDIALKKEDTRFYISKDGHPVTASKPFKDTDVVQKIEFDNYIEAQFSR